MAQTPIPSEIEEGEQQQKQRMHQQMEEQGEREEHSQSLLITHPHDLLESRILCPFTGKGVRVLMMIGTFFVSMCVLVLELGDDTFKWPSAVFGDYIPEGEEIYCEAARRDKFMKEHANAISNISYVIVGFICIACGIADFIRGQQQRRQQQQQQHINNTAEADAREPASEAAESSPRALHPGQQEKEPVRQVCIDIEQGDQDIEQLEDIKHNQGHLHDEERFQKEEDKKKDFSNKDEVELTSLEVQGNPYSTKYAATQGNMLQKWGHSLGDVMYNDATTSTTTTTSQDNENTAVVESKTSMYELNEHLNEQLHEHLNDLNESNQFKDAPNKPTESSVVSEKDNEITSPDSITNDSNNSHVINHNASNVQQKKKPRLQPTFSFDELVLESERNTNSDAVTFFDIEAQQEEREKNQQNQRNQRNNQRTKPRRCNLQNGGLPSRFSSTQFISMQEGNASKAEQEFEWEPMNHLLLFPFFSIVFGVTASGLGLLSFMYHSNRTNLTHMLDASGTYALTSVPLAYSLMMYLKVDAKPSLIFYARIAVLGGMMLLDILMGKYNWDSDAGAVAAMIAYLFIYIVAVVSLMRIRFQYHHREIRQLLFSGHKAWQIDWMQFAASFVSMAVSTLVRSLDAVEALCSPTSFFQLHALWHAGTALALLFTYFFLRSEKVAFN